MRHPLRLAVIGVGLIGARHLDVIRGHSGCTVAAIADPQMPSESLVATHNARYYVDHRELIEREMLDGVIIATPNADHVPVGLDCVAAGLPMLVEKPIADTLVAGRKLVEEADAAGVPLQIGHHRRFDPAVELARAVIDKGGIGQLVAVQALWALRKHDAYYDVEWRTSRSLGGGPGLINLIHDIDLLRYLCGDIERVYAELGHKARRFEVEDSIAATLRFTGGVLGSLVSSDATPSPWGWEQGSGENPNVPVSGGNAFYLLGTAGSLSLPRLEIHRHAAKPRDWSSPIASEPLPHGPRAALLAQLDHFCAVVRGEIQPRVSGLEGFLSMSSTLAVLASGESGHGVHPQGI